jgi:Cu/Zn superoxide dismutase
VQPAPALGRYLSSQGTGHSNPTGEEHGRHPGDLGNITAAEGNTAIVIHAEQEKTTGLPTG